MKCLHLVDRNYFARGHDCKEIFDNLTAGTQEAVRECYRAQLSQNTDLVLHLHRNHPNCQVFENALKLSRNAFTAVRYFFEKDVIKELLFYWPLLSRAVRNVLIASHPDWIK